MKYTLVFVFVFSAVAYSFGQKLERTQLGIQLRGIVPTKFIDGDNLDLEDGDLRVRLNQSPAAGFGVVVRFPFTETFTIESGLNYTRRRYNVELENMATESLVDEFNLRWVTYEVPLRLLLYVRTGEKTWINTAAGVVADLYPSNLERVGDRYVMLVAVGSWIKPALNVNFGFEYRTKDSGSFYFGAGYHRALTLSGEAAFDYRPDNDNIFRTSGLLEGHFVSLDLRYFFHEDGKK